MNFKELFEASLWLTELNGKVFTDNFTSKAEAMEEIDNILDTDTDQNSEFYGVTKKDFTIRKMTTAEMKKYK